jgi:hypothetical protein
MRTHILQLFLLIVIIGNQSAKVCARGNEWPWPCLSSYPVSNLWQQDLISFTRAHLVKPSRLWQKSWNYSQQWTDSYLTYFLLWPKFSGLGWNLGLHAFFSARNQVLCAPRHQPSVVCVCVCVCVCGLSFCPTKSSVKSFGWGGLQDMEFACFLPVGKKEVFIITCGGRYLVLST